MKPPTANERHSLRILIWIGILFTGVFLLWFFRQNHHGYALLYWPLTLASLFLISRLLAEWFYYYRRNFQP